LFNESLINLFKLDNKFDNVTDFMKLSK